MIKGSPKIEIVTALAKASTGILFTCNLPIEQWFENQLLRELPSEAVIVMDNVVFHRKKQLNLIAQNKGHSIMFLPAYSPELNPIEHFWAYLKC